MKTMLGATFQMTGQVCMAIKRIYVPAKRHDEFVESFRKAAESIVVGDGLEPAVSMGPLHTRKAQVRAEDIQYARGDGSPGVRFRVGAVRFESALTGRHSVSNLLAGIAVAGLYGIQPEQLTGIVSAFSAGTMRGPVEDIGRR